MFISTLLPPSIPPGSRGALRCSCWAAGSLFQGSIPGVSSLCPQQLGHAGAASIIPSSGHALGMKSSTLVCTSSFITCPRFLGNRDLPVQFSSSFLIPKKFVQVFLTDFFCCGIFFFFNSEGCCHLKFVLLNTSAFNSKTPTHHHLSVKRWIQMSNKSFELFSVCRNVYLPQRLTQYTKNSSTAFELLTISTLNADLSHKESQIAWILPLITIQL